MVKSSMPPLVIDLRFVFLESNGEDVFTDKLISAAKPTRDN